MVHSPVRDNLFCTTHVQCAYYVLIHYTCTHYTCTHYTCTHFTCTHYTCAHYSCALVQMYTFQLDFFLIRLVLTKLQHPFEMHHYLQIEQQFDGTVMLCCTLQNSMTAGWYSYIMLVSDIYVYYYPISMFTSIQYQF